MKFTMSSIVVPLLAACAVLPTARTASGAQPLYYLISPADDAQLAASGIRTWTRFRLDEREVAVVSAAPDRDRLPARMGARCVAIEETGPGEGLFVVTNRRGINLAILSAHGSVILSGTRTALIMARQEQADALADSGLELMAVLPPRGAEAPPMVRAAPLRALARDTRIQALVNSVTQEDVSAMIGNLSGENSVTIGGSAYTIQTRHSYQATPIQKATQYCYEYLEGAGLSVAYDTYTLSGRSLRNVVAEQAGSVTPDAVYIVCAHLDDAPNAAVAPGADDNASGSAAVLLLASILGSHRFESTIRYVLFTGEEQGLWGSYYYAGDCAAAGDQILGVINLDMIAYDGNGDDRIEVYCGTMASSGQLADLFIDTVSAYSLGLAPVRFTTGSEGWSDHSRFWDEGYPAILGIEDNADDFNPYYHTANDTWAHCTLPYATDYVKAAAGTMARLAFLADPATAPNPGWVNFQPRSPSTPPGFSKDAGLPFGAYGDYGWN